MIFLKEHAFQAMKHDSSVLGHALNFLVRQSSCKNTIFADLLWRRLESTIIVFDYKRVQTSHNVSASISESPTGTRTYQFCSHITRISWIIAIWYVNTFFANSFVCLASLTDLPSFVMRNTNMQIYFSFS